MFFFFLFVLLNFPSFPFHLDTVFSLPSYLSSLSFFILSYSTLHIDHNLMNGINSASLVVMRLPCQLINAFIIANIISLSNTISPRSFNWPFIWDALERHEDIDPSFDTFNLWRSDQSDKVFCIVLLEKNYPNFSYISLDVSILAT